MGSQPSDQVVKLAKVVGWVAIMASAVAQEYGAGINVVATSSIGTYPGIGNLVPLAMLVAGLILLPKVFMFQRFGSVISTSGGEYTWMSRTIHPRVGFYIHFLYFAGVVAGMGFLAYSVGLVLASTLVGLGISSGVWFATPIGHLVIGLIVIWLIFALHYTGVRNYAIFVIILLAIVLAAASISIVVGFATPSAIFIKAVANNFFHGSIPSITLPPLTYNAFFGTVVLFIFAYAGLSAAPLLGGETKNPKKDMPRGIWGGWLIVLVLFTLVALAVFHVMPAQVAYVLVKSKYSYYATVPGIISLVAPKYLGDILSILVLIILAKTIAPEMMATSRTLYEWSVDYILPKIFGHVNKFKAPDFSLFVAALIGTLFLMDTIVIGVPIVVIRSLSVLLVIVFLGIGVLLTSRKKEKKDWEKAITDVSMIAAAIAGIIVALIFIPSVIIVPHVPLLLQPSFQSVISLIIAAIIYEAARIYRKRRNGFDLNEMIKSYIPPE